MSRTVIGLFDDPVTARQVEQSLHDAHFARNRILLIDREAEPPKLVPAEAGPVSPDNRAEDHGDFADTLCRHGVEREKSEFYARTISNGGAAIILADLTDEEAERVAETLLAHRPIDPTRRLEVFHEHGFGGYNVTASPFDEQEAVSERNPYADHHYGTHVAVIYVM